MTIASLSELKKELKSLEKADLIEICLHLSRFKKENKELLNFLLFENQNTGRFIEKIKLEMDENFIALHGLNLYQANKSLRKILRSTNKYIKFAGDKQIEVELLIHFCKIMSTFGVKINHSASIYNLYQSQLAKISKAMEKLHEDLQFDFRQELDKL